MSHTVTAIFRTAEVAETVRQKIASIGVSDRHITVVGGTDQHSHIDALDLPHDETATYKQAVRQGNYVVSADVEDAHIDAVADIMRNPEQAVDIDAYETEYRSSPDYAAAEGARGTTGTAAEGQTIAVGEERLKVGKRTTEKGSAHVRTYVHETPVEERIRLREERLSVESRPVDRVVSGADAEGLFQDRDIEVKTKSEEAVVDKEAVVTKEVVVDKDVTEREEVVEDTVRKTEVDIDKDRT
ncbi:hypothetical protein OCGS_1403 [Oceaniovalibus guishaninsula JLT2003]|uniref:DUF2382 domain-containing protein n=1 Tax=Oceaniovalibus guishaninsula JLT2003 TaxID=1231392 RepID=K2I6F7_9RHOB|nr:YsnF/AvaK domain-containing protein [Oceaniovalibus guishaninsula]EKE44565.1 hypothetical protein OCGS_1403 [Oceaniovalibus guishaninsula JLT2003]